MISIDYWLTQIKSVDGRSKDENLVIKYVISMTVKNNLYFKHYTY